MRRFVKLVVLNHRVVTRGKVGGVLAVNGARAGHFWF